MCDWPMMSCSVNAEISRLHGSFTAKYKRRSLDLERAFHGRDVSQFQVCLCERIKEKERKKERMSSTCIWCRRLRVNATLFSLPNDVLYTFSLQEETFREALSKTATVAQYKLGFTLQTRKCRVVKVAGMAVLLWTHLGTCRGPGWSRPGSPAWWGHRSWRRWAWLRCPGWRPSSWSPQSHQPWWYLRRRESPVKRWPLGSEKTSCPCLFGAYIYSLEYFL